MTNPFTAAWDYVTGFDADNAQKAAEADAQLRADNHKKATEGFYTAGQVTAIQKNYDNQVTFGVDAQRGEVNQAFKEGVDEGAANVTGFFRGTFGFVGKALSSVLLGIPAWVWLLAVAGVFIWIGGGGWLLRKSRGALSK